MADLRKHQETYTHFQAVLKGLQQDRPKREGWVDTTIRGRTFQEPAWVVFEAQGMHSEVNRIRAEAGQPEVSMDDIWRVEGSAKGHVDYSRKFALYCTELALYGKSPA